MKHAVLAMDKGVPARDVIEHQRRFLAKKHFPTSEMVVKFHNEVAEAKKRREHKG